MIKGEFFSIRNIPTETKWTDLSTAAGKVDNSTDALKSKIQSHASIFVRVSTFDG
jgi:hypothetical protein